MTLKHDDLCARAWEYDYEQPIFDAENRKAAPPDPHKIPIQSDLSTEEMRNTPVTTHEFSLEIFSQTEELGDVTDTYPDMEPDVEASSEQQGTSPIKPALPNTTYVITRSLIAVLTTDINLSAELVFHGTRT